MKNKTTLITSIVMVVATVGLIAWDVIVAVNPVSGDTISEITLNLAGQFVLLPVAWGTLMGHFFSPLKRPLIPWWSTIMVLAANGLILIGWHLIHVFWFKSAWYMWLQQNAWLGFVYGIFVGVLVWTQKRQGTNER